MKENKSGLSRRTFLKAAAAAGAVGLTAIAPSHSALGEDEKEASKMPSRTLGRTGLKLNVIGYGTEFIDDLSLVEHLIEKKGVNYIDTASLYQNGNAERKLAPILRKHGDKLIVSTKWRVPKVGEPSKEHFIRRFNESCERMQVKGVDMIMTHDCRTAQKVETPTAREAFEELRKAGRVKYFGISSHWGRAECLRKAADLRWYDFAMVGWSFISPKEEADVMKYAAQKGMGLITMKVLKPLTGGRDYWKRAGGADKEKLSGENLFQASIKWNLKHDFVSAVVICVKNYSEADIDLAAASGKMTRRESEALNRYAQAMTSRICRSCGTCEGVCPQKIAIADILRYRDYHQGYGESRHAVACYQSLPEERTFANCSHCGHCEQACPFGLKVTQQLEEAHQLMV